MKELLITGLVVQTFLIWFALSKFFGYSSSFILIMSIITVLIKNSEEQIFNFFNNN
jgi:hypothetical protein